MHVLQLFQLQRKHAVTFQEASDDADISFGHVESANTYEWQMYRKVWRWYN